ncbi:hypothetical protein ACQKKK_08745 [Peribacillus sp. NPDC006672]|uniref:hypothetical protein n=1 Tax=Peribacillus sp. NPDC006672 TaxID=3390606 RepID=UPI003D01713E
MPQDNNKDPFNNAGNLDTRRDPMHPGFQREERPSPNRDIPTIEGFANIRERFPSDHERLMSRINLGDALINRENTHFGRFER